MAELETDPRLSLVFLVSDLSPCGEAAAARFLAASLPVDEFRVNVGGLSTGGREDRKSLTAAGITVEAIPVRHAMDFVAARRLRQAIRARAPSVIHAWGKTATRMARSLAPRSARRKWSAAGRLGSGACRRRPRRLARARRMRRADRVSPPPAPMAIAIGDWVCPPSNSR